MKNEGEGSEIAKDCERSVEVVRRLAYLREKAGRASGDVMFLQAEFMCMSAASRPDKGREGRPSR